INLCSGRNARHDVGIDLGLPKEFSVLRVHRKNIGVAVTEEHGIAGVSLAADRSDSHGPPHDRPAFKRPVDAAGLRIERVNESIVAADEHASGSDSRLRACGFSLWKCESPLQFQIGDLGSSEACGCCGLEASILCVASPSVP